MENLTLVQPATTAPVGPLLFNLSNVQHGPQWQSLARTAFVQVQQKGPEVVATPSNLLGTGDVVRSREQYAGPFRMKDTERTFATVQELAAYLFAQRAALVPAEGAAMVLGVDGSLTEIRPDKGSKTFKFKQLRPLIGADTLDIINFDHGPLANYILVIDENGKDSSAALNALATVLWFETYPPAEYSPIDVVVGKVVLMHTTMLR
jgi:hypothetical protein